MERQKPQDWRCTTGEASSTCKPQPDASGELANMSGKARTKVPVKKSRQKEKDDFNWREDPKKGQDASAMSGGYKSIKHRWLAMYMEQREGQGQQAAGEASTDVRGRGEAASIEPHFGRRRSLSSPEPREHQHSVQGDAAAAGQEELGAQEEAAAEEAQAAETEVREQAEKRAKLKTETSLRKDRAEAAATKARKEAEEELAQAAESDRAAHVASSMRKEARRAGYGNAAAQASHRSSQVAADTSAGVPQRLPALSTSGSHPARVAEPGGAAARTGSAPTSHARLRVASPDAGERSRAEASSPAPAKIRTAKRARDSERRAEAEMPHIKAERSVKTEAGSQGESPAKDDARLEVSHAVANGSIARQARALMQVSFLDGDEHEHLGELDLNQLDSFRDLWLTMRSAYSARLPKGELKLIYRDLDDDLMQHSDEPWDHFKAMAKSIFLARHVARRP